jgi:hypothetical protein
MAGKRKILVYVLGLAALLVLAAMVTWAGLPVDASGELGYSVVFLTGTYMGGNGIEHYAGSTRAKPGTTP